MKMLKISIIDFVAKILAMKEMPQNVKLIIHYSVKLVNLIKIKTIR